MGFIRAVLGIAIVMALIIFGYWLYGTYTVTAGNNATWTQVNSYMPTDFRRWSCSEVKVRMRDGVAPPSCSDVW